MKPTNPFATSAIRPGAIPYLFPEQIGANELRHRFESLNSCAAIIGPHGCGKTTLLWHLIDQFQQLGKQTHLITLSARGQSHVDHSSADVYDRNQWSSFIDARLETFQPNDLVAIDGFEQLTVWSRQKLIRRLRRRQLGVLVTAHHRCGLTVLIRLQPSLDALRGVVDYLLHSAMDTQDGDRTRLREAFDDGLLAYVLKQCRGDMREALFSLYDRWQELTLIGPAPPHLTRIS